MTYTEQKAAIFPETERLYGVIREAKNELDILMAKMIQLTMLEIADDHPKIMSFSFSGEFEYDDEGGWFWAPNFQSDPEVDWEEGDDVDERIREWGFDNEQIPLAFMSTNPNEGEITVIALRGLFGDPFHPGPPPVDPKGEQHGLS